MAINSDAHQAGDMLLIEYGVTMPGVVGWRPACGKYLAFERLLQYLENKPGR